MEIVKFSINNWSYEHSPKEAPFQDGEGWANDETLRNYLWNNECCKKNKICVIVANIDMSVNFCVTTTKEWVEKNCPCILGSEFEYEADSYYDKYEVPFLDYEEKNFGCKYWDLDEEEFEED